MTSILVKALEPFAKMFGELTEIKLQQGGIVFQYNNASITVSDLLNATNALSLYSQSMNTEDHARDYYMNDDGQSKPEPIVQDNEMWHPNYYPQSKEGEDFQQDLKEFDACFDHLYKMQGVKDAGHSWIEFTDKWNAFKKKLSSKENEGKQAVWVKATIRKPEKGIYHVKVSNKLNTVVMFGVGLVTIGEFSVIRFLNGTTLQEENNGFEDGNIEWLDESIQSGGRGEVERLKKELEMAELEIQRLTYLIHEK